MKFWVGVTDNQWFKFLTEIQPDKAIFWATKCNATL